MGYTLSTTVHRPFAEVLEATRDALKEQGFGILTEIDLADTLMTKIGAEIPPQVILGACRPPLAHAATQAEPSIGVFLPCNVVVRKGDDDTTVVEAMDPDAMVQVTGNEALADVAADARSRISTALTAVAG
jgi:uncharacterized protein (DUF302 family)